MYTVTFTRPYLKGDDRWSSQTERISARDEQQVRDIFADCEIINIVADCEEELQAFRQLTPRTTEADADAVHNYIVAAEAGDRAALGYGDFDLAKRRDDLLCASQDEPCTREQADAAIEELAELETKIVGGTSSPAWWDAQEERSL